MSNKVKKLMTTISEDLTDRMNKYFDKEAIDYFLTNYNQAKAEGRESKFEYYQRLAVRETDPVQQLMYEYCTLLNPQIAEYLAKDFYEDQMKNNTYSLEGEMFNGSDELLDIDSLNIIMDYGNEGIDKGLFAGQAAFTRKTPERTAEVSNIFETLFYKMGLNYAAKIVLISRLLLGSSTGKTRLDRTASLDLSTVMRKLPEEYFVVQNQIKDLEKAGLKDEEITATVVINGKMPTEELPIKVPRLLGKVEITQANKDLQEAMMDLSDSEDLDELYDFMYVNESSDNKLLMLNTLLMILRGKKVSTQKAIKAILQVIKISRDKNSPILKSKYYKDLTDKEIARNLIKMLASKNKEEVTKAQCFIMAPALFRNNKINKTIKQLMNPKGEGLVK
jgi:hypothetical protein